MRASEQKDTPLESPFGVSEQKDAPLESPLRVSEQKDASLECPLRVSEQKDAPLESPLGASEQKDTSLESPTAVSLHQRPLKWFPTAAPSGHWPLKWFPTVALSGHWLLKCFPMLAPSGHWPPKWFPMAANEWKLPLSAVRVGAYCIRPQTIRTRNSSVWLEGALICNCPCRGIGWGVCNTPLLLGTPLGHPPIKWFPTRANEWRSPLSAVRVGAYCIRPQMIRTRNSSVCPRGAYKMVSNDSAFGSAAPIIFFRENCNKRRASASQ